MLKLSKEEINKLNNLLLNVGFEGEGGFKFAPDTNLLGGLQITQVKILNNNEKKINNENNCVLNKQIFLNKELSKNKLEILLKNIGENEN